MASRGCLACRRRKVKCDEGRPSCKRCVKRGEACVGYRDDLDLMFRDENANAARRANTAHRRMSLENFQLGFERFAKYTEGRQVPKSVASAAPYVVDFNQSSPYSWTTNSSVADQHAEDHAVSKFFESYVMYPCNQSSSSGFLEHLPSLFREFDVEGRYALRWAVQAAAYADSSNGQLNTEVPEKALRCYGLALNALGAALSDPKQAPDDYTLMTVVVLDLFESLYLPDPLTRGAHAGGMAQILRLRGPEQIHGARGWSLFRLSHHRLQKQQLAFGKPPLPESDIWLGSLNGEKPDSQIERGNHQISKVCQHARDLLQQINENKAGPQETLKLIREMHSVDRFATTWRGGPEWSFKTLNRRDIRGVPQGEIDFPEHIQIHQDVWIAYEWNYHRTARIILHQNLLNCLTRLEDLTAPNDLELLLSIAELKELSLAIIQTVVDEILSTIPQSLGDIDRNGTYLADDQRPRIGRGVGAYFLLWPIKIIKHLDIARPQQVEMAKRCFERIRECTGMKEQLGDLSCI